MKKRKFRAMMTKSTFGHDGIWVWSTNLTNWSSVNGAYYGDIKPETITEYVCQIGPDECYVGDKLQFVTGQIAEVRFDEQTCTYRPVNNEDWRNQSKIVGNIFEKTKLGEIQL